MRKKSSKISTIILIIFLLVGLSVMLYPSFSNWWNTREQRYAIEHYNKIVTEIDDNEYEQIFAEAEDYNRKLAALHLPFHNYDDIENYDKILDISGTGIMGYITIPIIDVELPIYHGTSAEVLNVAAGHLQGSSLPVGGENTHAVISAHRGLPSARLFTDIDQLVPGDTFTITILDKVLTYEVEEINTVLPEEMDRLDIIPGGDYITLMTCTPYGINTHRLLIRSHRIETIYKDEVRVTPDAKKVDPVLVVPVIGGFFLAVLLIIWFIGGKMRRKSSYENIVHSLYDSEDDE